VSRARASSVAAPPPFRQPRSSATASRVKGTWRCSTSPRSRQREQAQTITSNAQALRGGPASMRWTRPGWSVASSRRTSSPPAAPAPRLSATDPYGRGWSPRRPGQTPGRGSVATGRRTRRAARHGRTPPRWLRPPPRGPAPAPSRARPACGSRRSCVVGDRGPIHRPAGVGTGWERDRQRRAEIRCPPEVRKRLPDADLPRRRETPRERPRLLFVPRSQVRSQHGGPSVFMRDLATEFGSAGNSRSTAHPRIPLQHGDLAVHPRVVTFVVPPHPSPSPSERRASERSRASHRPTGRVRTRRIARSLRRAP
jgi:hypothetical protein